MMQLSYSPEEKEFLLELRAFLRPWLSLNQYLAGKDRPALREFYRALGEKNWLALSWPKEEGGLGLSAMYEFLLWDELAHHRIARPPLSSGIVAKTIIRYGDEEQKAKWLNPIRTAELLFSLGYSEPEAGSDLSALSTRAENKGDHYLINGVKIWSSSAQVNEFLWLLCRTGEPGGRSRGLSLIIVDLKSSGLRIRPMSKMSGSVFCELTFDNVKVPIENCIGEEGAAWSMMTASLADERHVQFSPKRVLADFEAICKWVEENGLSEDPLVQETIADLSVSVLECQVHAYRVLASYGDDLTASIAAAGNKRASTDTIQAIARAAMEFGCAEAVLQDTAPEFLWRQTMEESIGGGTTEIMTSIVARNALGLKC